MDPQKRPFYASWLFWFFVILVVVLGISIYFLVNAYYSKSLVLEPEGTGESIRVHVTRLIAPVNGFLVLRAGTGGSPGRVLTDSPYIFSGTYNNFYIQFMRDISDKVDNPTYYADLDYELKNKFYAFFYKDVNKNGTYDESVDIDTPKDIFGKSLQVTVVDGKQL